MRIGKLDFTESQSLNATVEIVKIGILTNVKQKGPVGLITNGPQLTNGFAGTPNLAKQKGMIFNGESL